MQSNKLRTYLLGLDISTSCTGVSILDQEEQLVLLDAVKLNSTRLKTMWDKADYVLEQLKEFVGDRKIERVFVEANAKMFTKGFSSADTLMTLAKFNGIVSYITYKNFGAEIIDVNVNSARKAIGFKNDKLDKRPVKEKVFDHVIAMHPEFPWKKHVAKTGKSVGQEVFDAEMKDSCDSWVIVCGGNRILKQEGQEVNAKNKKTKA
jgi:Holliday junction resolvasome RuvABC endonuclease subunit